VYGRKKNRRFEQVEWMVEWEERRRGFLEGKVESWHDLPYYILHHVYVCDGRKKFTDWISWKWNRKMCFKRLNVKWFVWHEEGRRRENFYSIHSLRSFGKLFAGARMCTTTINQHHLPAFSTICCESSN
jgi:hypothetical protein